MKIIELKSRVILSSMGDETVEVTMTDSRGRTAASSVPAGISAGKYEVKKVPSEEAMRQIEDFKALIVGREIDQRTVDEMLVSCGMGGNASLAVSAAVWETSRIGNVPKYVKWPKLQLLLFEGGEHGNKSIAMQEFTIIEERIDEAAADFKRMKEYLENKGIETLVGAEGGFSPSDFDDERALVEISNVFGDKQIALDAAGSFKDGAINYSEFLERFKIISLEDPFSDEEWGKWREFYQKYGDKIMIVGDDLTVTNLERIKRALSPRVLNAVIIKPDQIGTISGGMDAVKLARESQLAVIVSHRGGETDDDWIADFALEAGADYVKFGGMERGERIAKYNRLRALGMK